MKRAYQLCRHMAWSGVLLTILLFLLHILSISSVAFSLIPFTLLSVVAAILNHMLPGKDRAVAKLGIRGAIYHPYLDPIMFTALTLFFFFGAYPDFLLIRNIAFLALFLYVIIWSCLLIHTLLKKLR